MKVGSVLTACAIVATGTADVAAAADRRADPAGAAQAYLDAVAAGESKAVCRTLTRSARAELARSAGDRSTCVEAAAQLPRSLGRLPIQGVEVHGRIARVEVGRAAGPARAGDFRMRWRAGRWRVMDA